MLTYFIMLFSLALVTFGIVYVIHMEVEVNMQMVIFAIAKIFGGMFIGGLVFMSVGLFFSSMSKSTNFTEGTSILFVLLTLLITVLEKYTALLLKWLWKNSLWKFLTQYFCKRRV